MPYDVDNNGFFEELEKIKKIEKYEHHGVLVNVQSKLKGKHRDHCLCFQNCVFFKPGEKDNCTIAKEVLHNCIAFDLVTPVYECPDYESK